MDSNDFSNNQNQNLISNQDQYPSQAEVQNNNQTPYIPPPNNYNSSEDALPPANPPLPYQPPNQNYPSIYNQPHHQPQTIYQQYNIPSPVDQNINPLPPQNINTYSSSSGIYDYQSNIPPTIPIPQAIQVPQIIPVNEQIPPEVIQGQNMVKPVGVVAAAGAPLLVEQIRSEPVPPVAQAHHRRACCEDCCSCCAECCNSCCECCGDCLECKCCNDCDCDCCDDQCCRDCSDFAECCLAVCQICLICLSCLGSLN